MSSVERGLRNVSILSIARIAAALEIPIVELLRTRRAASTGMPHWGPWDAVDLARPVEPMTDYLRGSDSAPGSTSSGWEPRHLSLG